MSVSGLESEIASQPPGLAVVVLAVGAPPELAGAVASLVGQEPRPELVVVNSGGGDAAGQLAENGLEVPVIGRRELLATGAARNVGIAGTRARFVAFLAADCRAEPGWVAARLRAHGAGAAAVASAIVNPRPRNLPSCAAHLSLHVRRWPGVPPAEALAYGASYARDLLVRHGGFRSDLARGEDSELHARLGPDERPRWEASVRTAHLYPRSVAALLADHWRRGARAAAAHAALEGRWRRVAIARNAFSRLPGSVALSWRAGPRAERPRLVASWSLLPAATLAYAAGALGGEAREASQALVSRQ